MTTIDQLSALAPARFSVVSRVHHDYTPKVAVLRNGHLNVVLTARQAAYYLRRQSRIQRRFQAQ
jgi:hypothetical protein